MAITQTDLNQNGKAPGFPGRHPRETDGSPAPWYLYAISGVISVVIGVLVLAYPEPGLRLLAVFLGLDILVVGILLVARGLSSRTDGVADGPGAVMVGALAAVTGIVVMVLPGETLTFLVLAFGISLIVLAALALARGILHAEHRWATIGRGLLLGAAGTVVIAWPGISLKTLALLAGISLVAQGALEIGEAFAVRSAGRRAAGG